MSSTLSGPDGPSTAPTSSSRSVAPLPAVRSGSPGWRDPRLWVGVLIVAASVLVGVRVLAAADDSVAVWAVSTDAVAGDRLTADDLTAKRVRFSDTADLARYYRVDDELPADLAVVRSVGSGELLPRAAVGTPADTHTAEVPLEVAPGLVPPDVAAGSVVDVYLVAPRDGGGPGSGGSGASRGPDAGAALSDVRVVAAPAVDDAFGPDGERQLVLAVPDDDVADYYAELSALTAPVVTVVSHPR